MPLLLDILKKIGALNSIFGLETGHVFAAGMICDVGNWLEKLGD